MSEAVDLNVVAALAACFVVWGLVSARFARWSVTGPIAFVAAGMVLTAGSHPVIEVSIGSGALRQVTELTLAMVLFGDAAAVSVRALEHDAVLPGRLLLVGLPLTIGLGVVVAKVLLPGLSWWECAVVGAAVAPTDAALGAAIISDERVPVRIRRVLNVESGLNDGIATPFVSFFLVAAVAGTAYQIASEGHEVTGLVLGALAGAVIGVASGRLLHLARVARWTDDTFAPIASAAVGLLTYTAVVAAGGNGFVAAFVAGLGFGSAQRSAAEHVERHLAFTERVSQSLSLVVWFLFGALVRGPLASTTWREVAFALLALTVVRMVPVAVSLVRGGLDRETVAVIGWFGPRGLASLVFALLAAETLPPAVGERVLTVIGLTVLASVVLHGASAAPIAGRYARDEAARAGPSPAA